jgi:hypothetical protein
MVASKIIHGCRLNSHCCGDGKITRDQQVQPTQDRAVTSRIRTYLPVIPQQRIKLTDIAFIRMCASVSMKEFCSDFLSL